MLFVPAVNTAKVTLFGKADGCDVINTLWFKKRVGSIALTDLEALGTAMNDWWIADILPYLSSTYQFLASIVYDYTTEFAPAVTTSVTGAFGGDAADPLPNNVAFCVKFLTANRGRSSRGRNYIGPLTTNDRASQNTMDAGVATTLVNGYGFILGLAIDADWEWSVASFRTGGVARAAAFVQPIIGVAYSDLTLDSARRRLPGRGD